MLVKSLTRPSRSFRTVAIFDVGKTHLKVILADLEKRRTLDALQTENCVRSGPPYPHYDVNMQEEFLISALTHFCKTTSIDAIFVTTHGAACALVDATGLVLPVLDYEHLGPDETSEDYAKVRPDSSVTGSPQLGAGLNLGAQLFWLKSRFPVEYARANSILFWPQYWAWRLSGVLASEISYISCHSDLFDLAKKRVVADSALVGARIPPFRFAGSILGPLKTELARKIGHDGLSVFAGAHDSSLALEAARSLTDGPITAVSTGTWVTAFALGVAKMPSRIDNGVMASLDLYGNLVPNFRFMGGQAYQSLLDEALVFGPVNWRPDDVELCRVTNSNRFMLVRKIDGTPVALPSNSKKDRERLVSGVIAQVTLNGIREINAQGPLLVSGPFSDNAEFCRVLTEKCPGGLRQIDGTSGVVNAVAALLSNHDSHN